MSATGNKTQSKKAPGIPLLSVRGIRIYIDFSWFIIFGLVLVSLALSYFPTQFPHRSQVEYWLLGFVSAILLFASVLLHELGHSLTAQRYGIEIQSITLFFFGGLASLEKEPDRPEQDLKIAAAGPFVSGLISMVCYGLALLIPGGSSTELLRSVLLYIGTINLILLVFNLVPGMPLDGGRIFRAILWKRWHNLRRATVVAGRTGKAFGSFLILLGIVLIILNPISGIWFIIIGMFIRQSAGSSSMMTGFLESLKGIKVRQIMNPQLVTIPDTISLDIFIHEYLFHYHYSSYPVVRDDHLVGMLSVSRVRGIDRDHWPQTPVQQVMTPLDELQVFAPEQEAVDVLRGMLRNDVGRFPVVEDGRLIGIISRREVFQLLRYMDDLGV